MKIYVASSWRNLLQPSVVELLRKAGHDVYDFRAPRPGVGGFAWAEIDPHWRTWSPHQFREALKHPIAERGYAYDIEALKACEACVLVLPCGRSAHWELGFAMGRGARGVVLMHSQEEPELMYRDAHVATTAVELVRVLR